jgi:hypothetical protein
MSMATSRIRCAGFAAAVDAYAADERELWFVSLLGNQQWKVASMPAACAASANRAPIRRPVIARPGGGQEDGLRFRVRGIALARPPDTDRTFLAQIRAGAVDQRQGAGR